MRISQDERLRKIAKRGRDKYLKYFNSSLVAEYIINELSISKIKINIFGKTN